MALGYHLLTLFIAVLCCTFVSSKTVFISNSTALEHYMCNESYVNVELVLKLNSSVTYYIQNGDFCIVQTKKIAIRSISSDSAVLRCSDDSTISTRTQGFIFISATITLQGVAFINCGTYLNRLPDNIINMFNSSSLYYSSTHAAALLFIQCTVHMSEVVLTRSYGFAVIGINLVESVLQNVHVSNSSASSTIYNYYNETIGCGMILHFLSYPQTDELKIHTVSVENSFFLSNANPQNHSCANKMDLQSVPEMILSAAALTILYTQHNYQANVYVDNSRFQYNFGTTSGAVLILHYNSHHGGIVNINNTYFKGNHILGDQQCYGADLSFVFLSSSGMQIFNYTYYLIVENTILEDAFFDPNDKDYFKTGVYIGVKEDDSVNVIILFKSLQCITTASTHTGVCMYAETIGLNKHGRVLVILESIVASNKSLISFSSIASYTGMFTFHGVDCYINGTKERPSTFSNNVGVVIDATDTNIYLSGDVLFDGNKATSGAAIKMKYGCHLHFMNGLTANFTNNQAELFGGAIYADVFSKKTDCAFYFQNKDIKLHFNNNIAAEAGNDIYASPIFYCQFNNSSNSYTPNQAMEFYKNHFHFLDHAENNFWSFSTKPTKLLLNNTMTSNGDIYTYPGQRKSLNFSALDELNRFVYTIVRVEIIPKKRDSISDLWLSYEDKVQIIQESRYKTFTGINFTVHTTTVYNRSFEGILILSLLEYPEAVYLEVHIHPCPPGFILDNITTRDCVCSPVLYTFAYENSIPVICSIQTQTISRSIITNSWAGLIEMVNGIKAFGISLSCPVGNCEFDVLFDYFYSTEMETAVAYEANDLLYTAPLCVNHREGTLCGKCNEGLSTVFGSRNCDSCSNKWLWTITIYFGLGALLICFLYAMRLTLTTGTLNGIIFFAQVTNGSLIDLSTFGDSGDTVGFKLAIGFLLFLNLNLQFPLCFYDGMTELWKTGLTFVFPIYLLTIVVVLIILSRYSTWLSNRISHSSVQVLVTVVHLSFSKLLLAIIDVFTPARIYTDNGYIDVWYWDGTVKYLSPEHCNLMICASLIVLTFIAPYIALLLLAKPLRRCSLANKYLRPVLEAIHAPYKEGKKYWFVLRLVLVILLYIIYAVYRGNNVFKMYLATGAILVFFLTVQAYIKPFKNNFLNLMDTWIMFNITFIYTTVCYFIMTNQIDVAIAITTVGVLLVFINFLLILFYHFLWVTGLLAKVERKRNALNQKILHHLSVFRSNNSNIRLHQPDHEDSFYDSCRQYREPILSNSD